MKEVTQKSRKRLFLIKFPSSRKPVGRCWNVLLTNKNSSKNKSYFIVSGPSHSKGLQPFRQWTRITWQYLLEFLFWILKHLEEGNKKSSNNHDESSVPYLHFVIWYQYLSNSPIITSPFNFHFFEAGTLWSILKGLLGHHIQWCPHCSFASWPGNLEQMHLMVWWYLQSSIPFSNDIESLEAFEKNGKVADSLHSPPHTQKKRKMVWKEASQMYLQTRLPSNEIAFKRDAFKRDILQPSKQKQSSHPIPIPHLLHTSLYLFHDFPRPPTSEPPRSKMSRATRPLATPRSSARPPGRGADLVGSPTIQPSHPIPCCF